MEERSESKHAKYHSGNAISQKLVAGFYRDLGVLYKKAGSIKKYMELGCGEGFVTRHLIDISKPDSAFAIDLDPAEVADAKVILPDCNVEVGSIYEVKTEAASFDMVVCCEVLEHLDEPQKALEEIHRISNQYVLLSVPREPLWRFLNMVRFKYWGDLGNTPDHSNHWSRKEFMKFVEQKFEIVQVLSPIPWTLVLAKKR
jgi:ubiquinone/menaquinone biosynthesis C-methylase UbiE